MAVSILTELGRGRRTLDAMLDEIGDAAGLPDRRDRDLFNALVFGVLRWRGRLDFILAGFSKMPPARIEPAVMNILRVALFQLVHLSRVPASAAVNTAVEMAKTLSTPRAAAFVNAVLRKAAAGHARIRFPDFDQAPVPSLAAEHSLPEWLVERWLERYGPKAARALCESVNVIPPLTLRTNTLKTTRPNLMQALEGQAEAVAAGSTGADAVTVRGLRAKLTGLAAFRDGWFQVQDEAAQLVSVLLAPRPGETVLDLCAGRGGKTGHIAQLMGNRGAILAVDSNAGRLAQLREEMRRLGVTIAATEQWDAAGSPPDALRGRFDRLLLDAPCSGLGTLGRNPDIRWSSSKRELRALAGMQIRLLENAANCLKPGGLLVYSVCSPEPEETEAVIRGFLGKNRRFHIQNRTDDLPDFARPLVDAGGCLQTYPHLRYMDGFFAVRLKRDMKN
ncbi:MAG: 16S rRNA (cytosine(967)-C(5))-methyltransferase RsmB [Desulfobacterales bacterium]